MTKSTYKNCKINKVESDMHKRFDSKGDDLLNDALRQSIKRKNDEFEAYVKGGLLNTIDYDGYPRTNMNELCGICKEQQMEKNEVMRSRGDKNDIQN